MDPSIMKLLEDDEDETMHSGADVEAFTAALNRDIEGDTSVPQPSESDSAVLSQGSNHATSQLFSQWPIASQDEHANHPNQKDQNILQQQDQHSPGMELKQHGSSAENQQQFETSQELNRLPSKTNQSEDEHQQQQAEQVPLQFSKPTGMQISEKNPILTQEPERVQNSDSESQYSNVQRMNNQQVTGREQSSNPANRMNQVPFARLLPVMAPQLDKDRALQLQTLYSKLRKNEIPKEGFVRHMRHIVGDQMLRMAVTKLSTQAVRTPQTGPNQFQFQSQASPPQHNMKMPSTGATQFPDPQQFTQLHQKGHSSAADPSHMSSTEAQVQTDASYLAGENSVQKSREVECQSDSHGMQVSQISSSSLNTTSQERERSTNPIQGLSKQQQQHLHFSQTSFPMYGSTGGSYHPYSGTNINTSASCLKPQPRDSQMRQVPLHQNMGPTHLGGATQAMNVMSVPKFERQNSVNDPKRVQSGSFSHLANNSAQNLVPWQSASSKEQSSGTSSSMTYVKQEPIDQANEQQHKSQMSASQGLSSISAIPIEQGNASSGALKDESLEKQSSRMTFPTSMGIAPPNLVSPSTTPQMDPNVSLGSRIPSTSSPAGISARTPPKKSFVGQKKPLEALGSSPPLPSKKQKVSGDFLDQSIDQLNDVTAVSGVDLREEEEQLFSGSKEDSRVSEASRRVVQEEEERLILQKAPLHRKLAQIMVKCGVKNISNDVERCLSLCVEERMRGLISNLVRLSKQRVDIEKPRHRTLITSDVRQQILIMNRQAREEWERKQAEAEKLRKLSEPEGNTGTDGDKDKDEGRGKAPKANKEEDDKMRTTAANVAARAAVGGDDMLSKWQLMAEQARQKREGGTEGASSSQTGKDATRKTSSTSGKSARDNQEAEKGGHSAGVSASGAVRRGGRNQAVMSQTRVARSISVKDVIAVLEREPQMSKSSMIYRLYEKMRADAESNTVK